MNSCASDLNPLNYISSCQRNNQNLHSFSSICNIFVRIVRRYQRDNQNPYIEEEQKTQWPKEKVQKDKQRSTKHTHKTKDWVTRTQLKRGWTLMLSWMVRSSYSTSGTSRVNIVTNPMISHEWGKDREVLTTSGTYPWSFVTQINALYLEFILQSINYVCKIM